MHPHIPTEPIPNPRIHRIKTILPSKSIKAGRLIDKLLALLRLYLRADKKRKGKYQKAIDINLNRKTLPPQGISYK
jgi:hypothetical protein